MFSIIVELPVASDINFQDKKIEGLSYQKTLFPAPAIRVEKESVTVKT